MEQQEAGPTTAPKAQRHNTKTPTANFTQTQEHTHTDSHQPTINLPSPAGNDPKGKGYFLDRESKQHLRPPLPSERGRHSGIDALDLHIPGPGAVPAGAPAELPPLALDYIREALPARARRHRGNLGVGGPRRPENPVTGLHVVDEAAITPAPPQVAEEVAALAATHGVAAVAWIAPVPVHVARMPQPRDLGPHGDLQLPHDLQAKRRVRLRRPCGPRSKGVPDEPEHVVHETRVLDGRCASFVSF
jgi:hypothetical protein